MRFRPEDYEDIRTYEFENAIAVEVDSVYLVIYERPEALWATQTSTDIHECCFGRQCRARLRLEVR